jgi:acid phosphatase type 7
LNTITAKISWALLLLCFNICAFAAEDTLIPNGATWKYLDNGTNQATGWRAFVFDDAAWKSGNAQFGYGDGDEATIVSYGPNSSAKYITTYFRIPFFVSNAANYTGLQLHLLVDDGAVVYLNGTEIHRVNMPTGSISYTTLATSALGTPAEATFYTSSLPNTLWTGTNVLAVEVHQANNTSSDLSFDLDLKATDTATVTRGPYLQIGTPNSMVVK